MKGVSAWNFDVAALKAEADRDADTDLPPIPEGHVPGQYFLRRHSEQSVYMCSCHLEVVSSLITAARLLCE